MLHCKFSKNESQVPELLGSRFDHHCRSVDVTFLRGFRSTAALYVNEVPITPKCGLRITQSKTREMAMIKYMYRYDLCIAFKETNLILI